MRLPASLASRLVLTAVGLVALVSLLVSVITTVGMHTALMNRLDGDVADSNIREIIGPIGGGPPGTPDELGPPGLAVVYDDSGTYYRRTFTSVTGEQHLLSPGQLARVTAIEPDGEVHDLSLPGLGSFRAKAQAVNGGVVVNGLSTDEVDDTVSALIWWEVLLGLLGVVVAFGFGQWLVRRSLAPLREVARAAQEVTRLDLARGQVGETVRVPDRLTDATTEVGQVGASLNSLLGHVERALDARERSEQQVRQFVADASHELRTPLTTIRGYAELAGKDPSVLPTSMTKVTEEAERMSALVEDLLLLARLDSGRPLAEEPVDLSRLVVGAVDDARVVDASRTWTLSLPAEPVVVSGDEQRLHQVVTNLLGNARRHTPTGTAVTTGLAVSDGHVRLTVHDDGPGVPADLDVFERFTRGDTSRTRASGGAGLGLSLVWAIVAAHGGEVGVKSERGDTTFSVTLPVYRASSSSIIGSSRGSS